MSSPPVRSDELAGMQTGVCVVGEGRPVLALHGWGGSIQIFWPVAERLAPRGYQVHLLDLPGFQRPFDSLTRRMQAAVDDALGEVDAALVLLNAVEAFGRGDRYIAATVAAAGVPAVVALNKVDLVDGPRLSARLEEARDLSGGEVLLSLIHISEPTRPY